MLYVMLLLLLIISMLAYMVLKQNKLENALAMIGEGYFELIDVLKSIKENDSETNTK